MNVDLELYRVFYVVANNENITKASKALMISQPAVSKAIKSLEDQLGGKLFVRTKRGVHLTDEGKEFYLYIKKAMDAISNAEHKFTDMINLEYGTIKIGVSQTLTKEFLLPYLQKFHDTYPKIQVQINTDVAVDLVGDLKNGLIDLVIINMPFKVDNDLKAIKVRKVHDCFVVNREYKQILADKINLADLNNYPLILQSQNNNTRKFLDSFCEKNGVFLIPSMTLASHTLVVEFAKIGYGIGYVTKDFITKELKAGNLYELNVVPKIPARDVGIIISKNNFLSFSARKLLEIILGNDYKL